jgi:hypothetical protein
MNVQLRRVKIVHESRTKSRNFVQFKSITRK